MRPFLPAVVGRPPLTSASAYLLWQARRQAGVLAGAVVCGVVAALALASLPALIGGAVDDAVADGPGGALWLWCGAILAVGVVQAAAGAVGHRLDVRAWLGGSLGTARLVGHHVTRTGGAVRTALPTGEVVSAVANDALRIGDVHAVTARVVGGLVAYAAVAVVLLRAEARLGAAVLLGLPLVAAVLGALVRPLQRRQARQREAAGRLATLGADTVAGLRVLRGIGGEEAFVRRYREQSQAVRREGVRVAGAQSLLDAMQALLPGLLLTGVVWYGARLAVDGALSPGRLVALYGYAAYLTQPLRAVTEGVQAYGRGVVAARKVLEVLRVRPAVAAPATPAALPAAPAPLVDEASGLVVAPGRVTALVSADPDASARVATRLGRFDDAAEAATTVRLGGVPLRDADVEDVRRRVVVAEATPHLFTGPLADGLDARGTATRDRLEAALLAADAGDVLESVPGGLDGELTEQGRALSGGQRQRVALARALLTDADVLVLVEPTSAVDAHTEARVARRLAAARAGRATLVVTASPLVLDAADDVALLVGGRVVATAPHRTLLRRPDGVGDAYRAVVSRAAPDDSPTPRPARGAAPLEPSDGGPR